MLSFGSMLFNSTRKMENGEQNRVSGHRCLSIKMQQEKMVVTC
ncbi:hypothetical protein HMPREF9086_3945 [Enterobacter hormaechei ATCC 49162]|nr:hypothetical protein HMPREF9086_3945 [Enterobacter hormaechei ATCC 49162]